MSVQQQLAALTATTSRKAKAGVTALAGTLPPADLPAFYEEAARQFAAAGKLDLAVSFFTQARKHDQAYVDAAEMDRLHAVFLEFVPLHVVAPTVLRNHVKAMALNLAPRDAHERHRDLLDAAFTAGFVPYPRLFPDVRRLAVAAGVGKRGGEEALAEHLLRTGVLPVAPIEVWEAAATPLAEIARRADDLLDLLIDAGPADDRARQVWLGTLAGAGAGSKLTADWFLTTGRRCPAVALTALAEQAGGILPGTPAPRDPGTDPLVPPAAPPVLKPEGFHTTWRHNPGNLGEYTARIADERPRIAADLTAYARSLGYYGNVDYLAELRTVCADPAFRDLLRELADQWTADAETLSLPLLEHALSRLAPLAESHYYEIEPDLRRPAVTDVAEALAATLRGGIAAELRAVVYNQRRSAHGLRQAQHGDHLTLASGAWAVVVQADGTMLPPQPVPYVPGEHALWYDGSDYFLTLLRESGWLTFRLEDGLLTLDPAVAARRPEAPSTGELTFPGAPAPSRISYARGLTTITAPDGTVTARVPFTPLVKQEQESCPPGWWPHLQSVDEQGSHALRRTTRAQAEALINAALRGTRALNNAITEHFPAIGQELRTGIAAVAQSATDTLAWAVRLADALNAPQPAWLPEAMRTRPDLPAGRSIKWVAGLRGVAEILQEAMSAPAPTRPEPIYRVELPPNTGGLWFSLGKLGVAALKAARPWTMEITRRNLVDQLSAWANTPLGDGSGRWRVLHFTSLSGDRKDAVGEVWRTPTSALLVLNYQGHPHKEGVVLEYAPDGDFGPPELPGWKLRQFPVVQGWGGADRIAAFRRLLAERGPVPADPAWVWRLADLTGLPLVDAAEVCYEYLYFVGTPASVVEKQPAEIAAFFTDPSGERLKAKISYPMQDAVRERLMPDDPADLWDRGPEIARAAARHAEIGDI
ncbi:hypothetical protein [Actinomadura hibisca]|uniref:hypothetical protein n=1 Tax=Actinomadura hibisca TaxID=68565 RepID=UPI00082ABD53|nr:hypothetical protein [Actinomadura hibisca]